MKIMNTIMLLPPQSLSKTNSHLITHHKASVIRKNLEHLGNGFLGY